MALAKNNRCKKVAFFKRIFYSTCSRQFGRVDLCIPRQLHQYGLYVDVEKKRKEKKRGEKEGPSLHEMKKNNCLNFIKQCHSESSPFQTHKSHFYACLLF